MLRILTAPLHLPRLLFEQIRTLPPQTLHLFEAVLVGVFFIQGLRYLIGILYAHVSSAALVSVLPPDTVDPAARGLVDPSTVTGEIGFLGFMVGLPILALLLGRIRWMFLFAILLVAIGRAFMVLPGAPLSPAIGASLAMGGGLLYIALVIMQRMWVLPYLFILSLSIDQLFRAAGDTLDVSWSTSYATPQTILSIIAVLLGIINIVQARRSSDSSTERPTSTRGLLSFWSGIGLGALLFLQLSLLGLPNAVAGRADVDYTIFVPVILAATLLPLIPWIRGRARLFIGYFDSGTRGWVWLLILALAIVIGLRVRNISLGQIGVLPLGGAALIVGQFAANLIWWWLARPKAERERNFTGLWVVAAIFTFGLLATFDFFTYEYAFVRNFSPDFDILNNFLTPLLRGFRGMGLVVLLLAVFLASLPMLQTQRRIPWNTERGLYSLLGLIVTIGLSVAGIILASPPQIFGVRDTETIRIGTYNIHAGYSEFFDFDLSAIAETIDRSGANVVLLQEVEIGRMTSFGVDQALWLGRRLGMDVRFFPTVEGMQGLAVLSDIEIVFDDGVLLTSIGHQTGLQRVQVSPDEGVITIYNTWLSPLLVDANGGRLLEEQEQDQVLQIREIRTTIARQNPRGLGRTVLGGTFNNVPDSPLIRNEIANIPTAENPTFIDAFDGQPFELSITLDRTGLPPARIDYIWLSTLVNIQTGVMFTDASDHFMPIVEVLIVR